MFDIDETGAGWTIIDNGTNSSAVTVSETGTVVSITVTLNINHYWCGDLICTLEAPDTTKTNIFYRIGRADNDPSADPGDGSDLGLVDHSGACQALGPGLPFCFAPTSYAYVFKDTGVDIWDAANTAGLEDPVPANTYYASDEWQTGDPANTGTIILLDTVFGGKSVNGNWTLEIESKGSNSPADAGVLDDWELHISAMP
jgi:subtilisin-like proprotein convertase family protein